MATASSKVDGGRDAALDAVHAFADLVAAATTNACQRERLARASKVSITGASLAALRVIANHEPIASNDVARRLGVAESTVSRQIEPLEQLGLVRRTTNGDDRRVAWFTVTPKGRTVLERVQEVVRNDFAVALSGWSDRDRETLGRLLDRLRADLLQTQTDASGWSVRNVPDLEASRRSNVVREWGQPSSRRRACHAHTRRALDGRTVHASDPLSGSTSNHHHDVLGAAMRKHRNRILLMVVGATVMVGACGSDGASTHPAGANGSTSSGGRTGAACGTVDLHDDDAKIGDYSHPAPLCTVVTESLTGDRIRIVSFDRKFGLGRDSTNPIDVKYRLVVDFTAGTKFPSVDFVSDYRVSYAEDLRPCVGSPSPSAVPKGQTIRFELCDEHAGPEFVLIEDHYAGGNMLTVSQNYGGGNVLFRPEGMDNKIPEDVLRQAEAQVFPSTSSPLSRNRIAP